MKLTNLKKKIQIFKIRELNILTVLNSENQKYIIKEPEGSKI